MNRTFLALALVVLSGCGSTTVKTVTVTVTAPSAPAPARAPVRSASGAAWTPLVTLRALGNVATSCVPRGRFLLRYAADPRTATEVVAVSVDGHILRKRIIQPGQHWTVGGLHIHRVTIWIDQGTEPQLIKGSVSVRPSERCQYGIPATVATVRTARFS